MPSMDLARSLIEREHVAVAPGSAFGELGEGYVRLSLASSRRIYSMEPRASFGSFTIEGDAQMSLRSTTVLALWPTVSSSPDG